MSHLVVIISYQWKEVLEREKPGLATENFALNCTQKVIAQLLRAGKFLFTLLLFDNSVIEAVATLQ